jgi:hypothetical protein
VNESRQIHGGQNSRNSLLVRISGQKWNGGGNFCGSAGIYAFPPSMVGLWAGDGKQLISVIH